MFGVSLPPTVGGGRGSTEKSVLQCLMGSMLSELPRVYNHVSSVVGSIPTHPHQILSFVRGLKEFAVMTLAVIQTRMYHPGR